jgi:hypothetical protein
LLSQLAALEHLAEPAPDDFDPADGTIRAVIEAAALRGELPARIPPDFIIDAVIGRVISLIVLTPGARRAAINTERTRYAESITDYVLAAIAT